MKKLNRREFLRTTGASSLLLSTAGVGFLSSVMGRQGGLSYDQLAPTNPTNFTNPLLLPSDNGLLGIFEPSSSFTMIAKEISHELFPGATTQLWVYEVEQAGRRYLNPILRVRSGNNFSTTLKNELREETVIHWHGLKVDGRNDAHPSYAIRPGGMDQYSFAVANRSAAYWYHPHPHPLVGKQVYMGLASFLIVEDDNEVSIRESLDLTFGETDIPLVLQDKQYRSDGILAYTPNREEEFMGFLGDVILVNLTAKPYLNVSRRIYRFRILNGSNARTYRLAFLRGSDPVPFHIVGNDGGLLAQPYQVAEVFLSPGERVDALLDLRSVAEGDVVFFKSLEFDPLHHEMGGMMGGMPSSRLEEGEEFYILKLNVRSSVAYDRQVPTSLSGITPINTGGANTRRFTLSLGHGGGHGGGRQWVINGLTFRINEYPVSVRRNTIEVWEITNDHMSMPHPMHIHGFPFQVLERMGSPNQIRRLAVDGNGLLPTDQGWKDTILVWPGEQVKIAIDFSHNFSGEQIYLFHCHNLEHEDQGMMINYKVV